jgi:hypothetical protein
VVGTVGMAGPALAQSHYTAVPVPTGQSLPIAPPTDGPGLTMTWETVDGGGRELSAGAFRLGGTVGQGDAGVLSQGSLELSGGFWGGVESTTPCFADCDGSGALTANDFACFLNMFNTGQSYANCDGSTVAPALNALDFICFMNKYAVGCS